MPNVCVTSAELMSLLELWDVIHSFAVIVIDGETVGTERPSARIIRQHLWLAPAARPAHPFVAAEPLEGFGLGRCLESFVCGHEQALYRYRVRDRIRRNDPKTDATERVGAPSPIGH